MPEPLIAGATVNKGQLKQTKFCSQETVSKYDFTAFLTLQEMDVARRALRKSLLTQVSEIISFSRYSSNTPNNPKNEPSTVKEKPVPVQAPPQVHKERVPRIGDDGFAVTLMGAVKPKDDQIFHAMGSCDELCSFVGLAREYAHDNNHTYVEYLKRIQTLLIDISVAISNCNYNSPNSPPVSPTVSPSPLSIKGTSFSKRHAAELEEWIEEYSESLPPVEHFVIPGGGQVCAVLHVALSICRRAERKVLPLVRDGNLDPEVLVYLNRLAEFLFVISRVASQADGAIESVYTPKPSPSSSS
ncbi:corrinoid adenosyltransferase-like [Thrips palmi]|uniref:Corrinoid adenosyltransferase-like n=1 Tax=Thrips palmi TaxID=161013 RepID=A0A6P8YZB1_THRPL|nr:corrinoid adenosyltransferase-like [Thrips palmi]